MMSYKKGDIVLVPFPFTDGTSSKKRPSLIVSQEHHHNTYGHKYVCLMITSQESSVGVERYEHLINGPFLRGLRLEPSWVIVDRVFSTDKEFIIRKLGYIGSSNLNIIEKMLETIYKDNLVF